jgi:hypothetical protein
VSRDGRVEIEWPDERRAFRLGIGELEELQERTGAGPAEVLRRLYHGTWKVAEVREPLRLGLIGGGMSAADALKLVNRYAGPGQLMDAVVPAMTVVNAALNGVPDEPVGNGSAVEEAEGQASRKAGSPSPLSTEPAQ